MYKKLKELSFTKECISIYSNSENTKSFDFGMILSSNEEETAIEMIAPSGKEDGILVLPTWKIFRVDRGDLYSEKMKRLCAINYISPDPILFDEESLKRSLLRKAMETQKIVSIELMDSGIFDLAGFVQSEEDGWCTISSIDEYGLQDGVSCISLQDMTKICYDSEEEKIKYQLYQSVQSGQSGDGRCENDEH